MAKLIHYSTVHGLGRFTPCSDLTRAPSPEPELDQGYLRSVPGSKTGNFTATATHYNQARQAADFHCHRHSTMYEILYDESIGESQEKAIMYLKEVAQDADLHQRQYLHD